MSDTARDPLRVELGRGLLPLLDRRKGAPLLARIPALRQDLAQERGMVLPGVRFIDNEELPPDGYLIRIREERLYAGNVIPDMRLAVGPEQKLRAFGKEPGREPAYGMPCAWIAPGEEEAAVEAGILVYTPVDAIVMHLMAVASKNAHLLLTRHGITTLIERLRGRNEALAEVVTSGQLPRGAVKTVLCNLLRERVGIGSLETILQGMLEADSLEPDVLYEAARTALSEEICAPLVDRSGLLKAISVDPRVEKFLARSVKDTSEGRRIVLPQALCVALARCLSLALDAAENIGTHRLVVCSPATRLPLFHFLEAQGFEASVLSTAEVPREVQVERFVAVGTGALVWEWVAEHLRGKGLREWAAGLLRRKVRKDSATEMGKSVEREAVPVSGCALRLAPPVHHSASENNAPLEEDREIAAAMVLTRITAAAWLRDLVLRSLTRQEVLALARGLRKLEALREDMQESLWRELRVFFTGDWFEERDVALFIRQILEDGVPDRPCFGRLRKLSVLMHCLPGDHFDAVAGKLAGHLTDFSLRDLVVDSSILLDRGTGKYAEQVIREFLDFCRAREGAVFTGKALEFLCSAVTVKEICEVIRRMAGTERSARSELEAVCREAPGKLAERLLEFSFAPCEAASLSSQDRVSVLLSLLPGNIREAMERQPGGGIIGPGRSPRAGEVSGVLDEFAALLYAACPEKVRRATMSSN